MSSLLLGFHWQFLHADDQRKSFSVSKSIQIIYSKIVRYTRLNDARYYFHSRNKSMRENIEYTNKYTHWSWFSKINVLMWWENRGKRRDYQWKAPESCIDWQRISLHNRRYRWVEWISGVNWKSIRREFDCIPERWLYVIVEPREGFHSKSNRKISNKCPLNIHYSN